MGELQPKTHTAVTASGGAWRAYADVMVGTRSLARLLYFEWCAFLATVPGAGGMFMRKVFWPKMFGSCGKGVQFGAGITVRHPHRIHLGARVVVGEHCTLDARAPESDRVIEIENDVMMSVGVMLSCKGGKITVGSHTGLGPGVVIQSTAGEPVTIGRDGIVGAGCYFTGGGNYNTARTDIPIRLQGKRNMGGTTVGEDVWFGARSVVLGGVTVGRGSIIGAGSVVTRSIPDLSVCVGVPARVIRHRGGDVARAPE